MGKEVNLIKLDSKNFTDTISIAISYIKKGGVILSPTDTVYGLLTDATFKEAVKKVFMIKQRNYDKKIPIFVKDITMAKKIARISKKTEAFLKKIWPGKVTVVLRRNKRYKIYGVDKDTVALRMPNNRFILSLLRRLKKPLTATSANISGLPPSTQLKPILSQFQNRKHQPDLIIYSPLFKKSKPSTIISLVKEKPKVLRKGEITYKTICSNLER